MPIDPIEPTQAEAMLELFNGGCIRVPSENTPSGFAVYYRPEVAMQKVIDALSTEQAHSTDFQSRVDAWMDACFGEPIKSDQLERADRFTEEALELAQTIAGFTKDRAYALVDYVFDRPQGEINQEVGGVMVTLAALCNTTDVRIDEAAATELARVWTKVDQIRAKHATKPTGSALPVARSTDSGCHPSHKRLRSSDASTYDLVCEDCGATDQSPGGWGGLANPCSARSTDGEVEAIATMMSEFVDNWPEHKKFSTSVELIAKTLRASRDEVASLTTDRDQWKARAERLGEALIGPDTEIGGRLGWLHALLVDLREKIENSPYFRETWEFDDPSAAWEALRESEALIDAARQALEETGHG